MSVIDEIKARLDLVDEIGKVVKLKRAGKNYTGFCPFHSNTKTPAFVVFPGSGTWRCFGSCNEGGDLFDFVMKKEGWEFKEALRELAGRAGVELRPLSQEEQAKQDLKRDREQVFAAAARFFQSRLLLPDVGEDQPPEKPTVAVEYARDRGFTIETLRSSHTGYFDGDWDGLKQHLSGAGIDLLSPAAVALVGFRGDVAAWARDRKVHPAPAWVEQKRIPAMPPDMLIYAHVLRGRVQYLSARRLHPQPDMPKSWNPPLELAGPRQPFFNHAWFDKTTERAPAAVVEGQADALSLGQWGIAAVALAGVSAALDADPQPSNNGHGKSRTDNVLLSVLRAKTEAGSRILIGLDADPAGELATEKVIQAALALGLTALQIGTVRWPEKDANEWLQQGATAEQAARLLAEADTWLDTLVARAMVVDGEKPHDDAVRAVFVALARLSPFDVEKLRDDLCDKLDMRRRMFDGMLRAARREVGLTDDGQPRYFVEAGRIMVRYFDAGGGEVVDPLCNFSAEIREDILKDNGLEIVREFKLTGSVGKIPLPPARVLADDFNMMNWVIGSWGSRAIIEAGSRRRDQLRAAIQHLSRDVERRVIYTHTGWREIGEKRMFLTAAGAVGAQDEEITVELDRDLALYSIPNQVDDLTEAIRASLDFLEVAPPRVAYPIWSAMWLAPLRDLANLGFALWIFGGTGAMKSTYTALAMNHYGPGFDDKHLPASFMDTANRLEQKAFVVKDCPLVIDDYAPQKDAQSHKEYIRAAHRIVRGSGNLTGRGRLNSDSTARLTYEPRALVIVTGEDLPDSESLVSRLFVVEINRGDIDKEQLTALQRRRALLSQAMSGYLHWARDFWKSWEENIPSRWQEYRRAAFNPAYHLRLPEAVAGLALGVEMGLRYALFKEVIDSSQYTQMMTAGWDALMEGAAAMSERVKEEKPEALFTRTIGEMLTQGKIFFKSTNGQAPLGGPEEHSEMMGWHDDDRLYLLPEASYNRVSHYFRDQGNVFPVRESTLRKMLAEAGIIEVDNGRRTTSCYLDGATRRVLIMRRSALNSQTDANETPTEDQQNVN